MANAAAEIAAEVDRLVVGVHRAVMVTHGAAIRGRIDPLELDSPGQLMDLAEFFLANECTVALVQDRFPYDGPDLGPHLFTQLEQQDRIDGEGHPAKDLRDTLREVLVVRAQVAASMWSGDLSIALRGAGEALAVASGNVTDVFRSLPEPEEPAHRLHHLLTGLRYARLDAHVLAWQGAGLTPLEVVALDPATSARVAIEIATNERSEPMLAAIDDLPTWYESIASLRIGSS